MSFQNKLFSITTLASQIEAARLALPGDRPKPGDAAFVALQRKIDGWEQTVKTIQRNLKSQSHFNHMVHQHNRFGAGAFAAKQRLNSQENNVAALMRELLRAAASLSALNRDLYAGGPAEQKIMEAIAQAMDNWQAKAKTEKDFSELSLAPPQVTNALREVQVSASSDLPVGAPQAQFTAPGIDTVIIALLTLIALLKSKRT